MIYLSQFEFPHIETEYAFLNEVKHTCYDTVYPFQVLSRHQMREIEFAPVTIFYGGNGSGKTTALNVIAEKLHLQRDTLYNRSNFFEDYTKLCRFTTAQQIPNHSRMITSDDVFDYLLDLRCLNDGVDHKREDLLAEYQEERYASFRMKSLDDYEKLKRNNDAKRMTGSKYVKKHVMENIPAKSNGQSAFGFFTEHIRENALYLLDEPENSLAADLQIELSQFLENAARFYHCQFIIATHSPFLLAMKHCRIYDLDAVPVQTKRWSALTHVRTYYDFFMSHREDFV